MVSFYVDVRKVTGSGKFNYTCLMQYGSISKWALLLVQFTVLTSCLYAQEQHYQNPVSDSVFVADPFVLKADSLYYLYGTSAGDGFKYWTSTNLIDWQEQGYVLRKTEDSWGKTSFWAPEVFVYRDKFYLLYSAQGETIYGRGLRLCLAISDAPTGPFSDLYAPWFDFGFSCIDGHLYMDGDSTPYLYYEQVGAIGEHWKQEGYLWGMIMGTRLSSDLARPIHEPKLCLNVSQHWEGPESLKARSVEGMTVFKLDSLYYMTYSANHYADPNYGVGYATCKEPLGMWVKSPANPILRADLKMGVSGPGHNSITRSPDGKEWFIVYHSHADPLHPSGKRILNVDRLIINPDQTLSVLGPTRTPQPLPSGTKN